MSGVPALVEGDWLEQHLDDPRVRVLDCTVRLVPHEGRVRPEPARDAWAAAHIPGSQFADLVNEFSDRDSPLPMMMPRPEAFATAMGKLGVGEGVHVICYDTGTHMWATRLWWMLRAMGFDAASVLDGGFQRWQDEGRPVTAATRHVAPVTFRARPRPGVFVDKDAVLASLGREDVRLINALSADEHRGHVTRVARKGHIPGSGNVPAGSLVDPVTHRFLHDGELRERFEAAGALDAPRVITYCGGGIAATSVAFNLVRQGARDVAVYDGSLAEWSADPSLPMTTGDDA